MPTGIIKWFQPETGVGFIEQDGTAEDVLVMQSALRPPDVRPLKVGEKLEFDLQESAAGPAAINVRRLSG